MYFLILKIKYCFFILISIVILLTFLIKFFLYFELIKFNLEYLYMKKQYCQNVTIDSIHCINLKRSPDRKKLIDKESKKIGKKINIFEAIDGDIHSRYQQNKLHPNGFSIFSHSLRFIFKPRTIACATSHMMLLKSLKKNNENVLILEDDIIVKDDNFIDSFQKITNDLPINWDIIFFNPDSYSNKDYLIDLNRNFYYVRKTTFPFNNPVKLGAYCYLVNKNSIHKIIKHSITCHFDILLTKINLNIYLTKQNFIEHNFNLPSTRVNLPSIIKDINNQNKLKEMSKYCIDKVNNNVTIEEEATQINKVYDKIRLQ